jgi:N-acetylglucosamine-6-phosphate deacetylase
VTEALSRTTVIRAARAVDARGIIEDVWMLIAGSTIQAVGSGPDAPAAHRLVELGETTLVPGFIDLHGHGGAQGAYDNGPDEITAALAMHRQHGTTRAVLSLVANPLSMLARSLETIRDAMSTDPLIIGAHLEGPFLSPHNRGAHRLEHLLELSQSNVSDLLNVGRGVLTQITIAPELAGAREAIRQIVDGGVIAAVGHTIASQDVTRMAFDAGATVLTHAFNAMPGIHHREPGPIMAAVDDERVTLELILDGVHVAPIVARTLFQATPGRVALITDAMAATGSPDGAYLLGSLNVTVANGIARVDGSDTIAGSTLTQDAALRMAVGQVGLSLKDAVTALTATPAKALNLGDRLGYLAQGFAADIVGLTTDLAVSHVWANGAQIATRPVAPS